MSAVAGIDALLARAQIIRAQQGKMVRFVRDDGQVCEFSYATKEKADRVRAQAIADGYEVLS